MAKVLFLSILLSMLLSFHMALGDSGWIIPSHGMDHICRLTQDYVSADMCRVLQRVSFGRALSDYYLSARVTECIVVLTKIVLKPKMGLHIFVGTELTLKMGQFVNLRLEITNGIVLQTGRYGLFVQGCSIVDIVVKGRSHLTTDAIQQMIVDTVVKVLTGPMCERGRAWCKELNYCFDFIQQPFPITPSCYGIWKNQPPRVTENQIELRSQPVCTCRGMEDGVSVAVGSTFAFRATISPTEQSVYFCHEKDISYIFECMRRGGAFNGFFSTVALNVGSVMERFPSLVLSCPRTANIVIKIECTRIHVDMQAGHALVCIRMRANIGCDRSNFTSAMNFIVTGCLNLYADIDCRRGLLLLSVSARGPLRMRNTCAEGEECESEEGSLTEMFQRPLTAWCVSHINAKISGGIRISFLSRYPCDECQKSIYARRRVYAPCTLRYAFK